MYKCSKCNREFELGTVKRIVKADKTEYISLCPFCENEEYEEIENTKYCRCCGAKLRKNVNMFCTVRCKKDFEELKNKREAQRKKLLGSKIYSSLRECEEYNLKNGANLSYGRYFALKDANKL